MYIYIEGEYNAVSFSIFIDKEGSVSVIEHI